MTIDIKRVCIHECCHAVVARLFRQRMAMEGVVVNTGLSEGGQDLGALNVNGPILHDERDYTSLAMTLLAGVVGENIYLQGPDAIREKKEEIIANHKILDWLFAGGDLPAFRNTAFVFGLMYQVDEGKLKSFCLGFLIDFLGDAAIWGMVEKLCDEVSGQEDLQLSEEELESVFEQIGLDALLDERRKSYLYQCDGVLSYCQRHG